MKLNNSIKKYIKNVKIKNKCEKLIIFVKIKLTS